MKPHPKTHSVVVPKCWSAEQALTVFEFVDLLREEIWKQYRDSIQAALREHNRHDPRQLRLDHVDTDPF